MLTDIQLKKAKGGEKDYKLADGGGLHVLVSTTGNRSWRLKYRFRKKEKLLTIGMRRLCFSVIEFGAALCRRVPERR